MNQPANAQLGRTKSGMKIGYRLLSLDRTVYQSFTNKNVVEVEGMAGMFAIDGGISNCPTAGGYIQWGTKQRVFAEAPIEPAPPTPAAPVLDLGPLRDDILKAILAAVATLKGEMANIVPTVQAEMEVQHKTHITEMAKVKPAQPVTIESLAKRLEAAEARNQKLTNALGKFLSSIEQRGI